MITSPFSGNNGKKSETERCLSSSDRQAVTHRKLERQLTSDYDIIDAENKIKGPENTTETTFVEEESHNFQLETGVATNIGGGHENQDKYLCFRTGKHQEHLVMAVFDGHGRDLGKVAAITARDYFKEQLEKPTVLESLEKTPQNTFNMLFDGAHNRIKEIFRKEVEAFGDWEVVEADTGYLVKRQKIRTSSTERDTKRYQIFETNIHGGTTATVVIVLNSERLLVANVGDSTAIFGGQDSKGKILFKELSTDHSPESLEEYKRVKSLNAEEGSLLDNDLGSLQFVYDVLNRGQISEPKYSCPPIFTIDYATGVCKRTLFKGSYYKNVRSEWASLVTTPPNAKFQDALAFTRSLGDLHLHVYGVCHTPEVKEYSLAKLKSQVESLDSGLNSVLLVCTDGVWDNWQYNDILRYIMSTETALNNQPTREVTERLTDELMNENLRLAREHFGNQADNMTGIVCTIMD